MLRTANISNLPIVSIGNRKVLLSLLYPFRILNTSYTPFFVQYEVHQQLYKDLFCKIKLLQISIKCDII